MNEDVASLPDELQAAVRALSCKHGPLSVVSVDPSNLTLDDSDKNVYVIDKKGIYDAYEYNKAYETLFKGTEAEIFDFIDKHTEEIRVDEHHIKVKHSGQMKKFLAKNDTSFKQMYFSKIKAFVKRGKRGKPLQDHMEKDMRRMVGNFRALKSSHPTSVKGLHDKWRTLKDLQEDLGAMNDMYESLMKQPSSVFLICRDELSTLDDVEIESFKAFAEAYEVSGSCIERHENDFIAK